MTAHEWGCKRWIIEPKIPLHEMWSSFRGRINTLVLVFGVLLLPPWTTDMTRCLEKTVLKYPSRSSRSRDVLTHYRAPRPLITAAVV